MANSKTEPEALERAGDPGSTDYLLTHTASGNSVWVRVRNIAVHIVVTDEGVVVDLFMERTDADGRTELSDESVGSTYAFFDEGAEDAE